MSGRIASGVRVAWRIQIVRSGKVLCFIAAGASLKDALGAIGKTRTDFQHHGHAVEVSARDRYLVECLSHNEKPELYSPPAGIVDRQNPDVRRVA